jgi:anti-sigma B factor antagonist
MILALSGELDAVNSPRPDHAIADLLAKRRRQFLIDLIAVNFVDSSGLSALVRGLKRVRTGAGTLERDGFGKARSRVLRRVPRRALPPGAGRASVPCRSL